MSDLPPVFWLTRDRLGGELADKIEVWSIRPERVLCEDGDVLWCPPEELLVRLGDVTSAKPHQIDEWTVAEGRIRIGSGIPENDRECVRVGDEPVPLEAVS